MSLGRLKGRALSLTPPFRQYDHRGVALVCLLSIALRVLVLMQLSCGAIGKQVGATLKGIYPGQPGRATAQPTTEMMWSLAWRDAVTHQDRRQTYLSSDAVEYSAKTHPRTHGSAAGELWRARYFLILKTDFHSREMSAQT